MTLNYEMKMKNRSKEKKRYELRFRYSSLY